ncbi:N-acetylmuramoyl-L-alanine amidase [Thermoproteota archaeon]
MIHSQDSFVQKTDQLTITFNNQVIRLDTPIIKRYNTSFFPIRDAADHFGVSIKFLRKDHSYHMTFKGKNWVVYPNYNQVIINDKSHTLIQAPFYFDNRLYFPLTDFGKLMKIPIKNLDRCYIAKKTKQPAKIKPNTSAKPISSESDSASRGILKSDSAKSGSLKSDSAKLVSSKSNSTKSGSSKSDSAKAVSSSSAKDSKNSSSKSDIKQKPKKESAKPSYITHIQESISDTEIVIDVIGKGLCMPAVWSTHKPPRLILDFDNCISTVRYSNGSANPVYTKIRASQYSTSPLKSRVVVDLHHPLHRDKFTETILEKGIRITFLAKRSTVVHEKQILRNKIIALDPGHGGRDPGAVGINREFEKHIVKDISERLERRLSQNGAKVIMLRKGDSNPSLAKRARLANQNKADILISIHTNSFFKAYANGTESYYFKSKDKTLARYLHREMVKTIKLHDIGVKQARLYILSHSTMPAALVEPGFISNPKEIQLLRQPKFRDMIAESLYKGIINYFKSHPK